MSQAAGRHRAPGRDGADRERQIHPCRFTGCQMKAGTGQRPEATQLDPQLIAAGWQGLNGIQAVLPVTTVRDALVAVAMAVTVAPGRAAPFGAATRPTSAPAPTCANVFTAPAKQASTTTRAEHFLMLIFGWPIRAKSAKTRYHKWTLADSFGCHA